MNEHELGFLAFLAEPSRRRLKTLIELGAKRRRDVRLLLDHAVLLDPRFSRHLAGSETFAAPVETMLRQRGAPATCYVIAARFDLDQREMPLGDALAAIIGMGDGAFVSCVPGRLGIYQYAEMQSLYLLAR